MRLRSRLGIRQVDPRRPRAPRRCTTCHLIGHNAATCQIDQRMRELTGDDMWEFHVFEGELPVPTNVIPIGRRVS